MTNLHPLPAPGTVEAFVIDVLDGAALQVQRMYYIHEAAWRFIRWIDLCERWRGVRREEDA